MKNTFIAISILFSTSIAFAWGQYGHQQINSAAVDTLGSKSGLAQCMQKAKYVVTRYAITPDMEWKTDVELKTLAADDSKKRSEDDLCEHPLHFFEADAFVKNPKAGDVASLPSANYPSVYPKYRSLLAANAAYVVAVDPSKAVSNPPLAKEVVLHGTAPWRAAQLYTLGVNALKAKNTQLALYYLATMGHYVGDMSQPFHATLDYDGDYYPPGQNKAKHPHDGIHHEIDTGLLPEPKKDANDVFSTFTDTDTAVLKAANQYFSEMQNNQIASQDDIVKAILKIIDTGVPMVDILLENYTHECNLDNGVSDEATLDKKSTRVPAAAATNKVTAVAKREKNGHVDVGHGAKPMDQDLAKSSGKMRCTTVTKPGSDRAEVIALNKPQEKEFAKAQLDNLEDRLARSAALLAKLWQSAYEDAGKPDLGDCSSLAKFDQSYAIQNYPKPDYYPSGQACVKK